MPFCQAEKQYVTSPLGAIERLAIDFSQLAVTNCYPFEKLPRSSNKYISSFIGFSDVTDPTVIAMCLIDEPQGVYYGGTIAAPVIKELYENILPYMQKE